MIIDEGHRIKNNKSKLFEKLQNFTAHHKLILTGTPMQNHIQVWIVYVVCKTKLFSYKCYYLHSFVILYYAGTVDDAPFFGARNFSIHKWGLLFTFSQTTWLFIVIKRFLYYFLFILVSTTIRKPKECRAGWSIAEDIISLHAQENERRCGQHNTFKGRDYNRSRAYKHTEDILSCGLGKESGIPLPRFEISLQFTPTGNYSQVQLLLSVFLVVGKVPHFNRSLCGGKSLSLFFPNIFTASRQVLWWSSASAAITRS